MTDTQTKHTPGPWRYHPETDEIISHDGELVVNLRDRYCNAYCAEEYFTGNASLIASAPDLLAACETMLADCENVRLATRGGLAGELELQLRAAVRAAKGE